MNNVKKGLLLAISIMVGGKTASLFSAKFEGYNYYLEKFVENQKTDEASFKEIFSNINVDDIKNSKNNMIQSMYILGNNVDGKKNSKKKVKNKLIVEKNEQEKGASQSVKNSKSGDGLLFESNNVKKKQLENDIPSECKIVHPVYTLKNNYAAHVNGQCSVEIINLKNGNIIDTIDFNKEKDKDAYILAFAAIEPLNLIVVALGFHEPLKEINNIKDSLLKNEMTQEAFACSISVFDVETKKVKIFNLGADFQIFSFIVGNDRQKKKGFPLLVYCPFNQVVVRLYIKKEKNDITITKDKRFFLYNSSYLNNIKKIKTLKISGNDPLVDKKYAACFFGDYKYEGNSLDSTYPQNEKVFLLDKRSILVLPMTSLQESNDKNTSNAQKAFIYDVDEKEKRLIYGEDVLVSACLLADGSVLLLTKDKEFFKIKSTSNYNFKTIKTQYKKFLNEQNEKVLAEDVIMAMERVKNSESFIAIITDKGKLFFLNLISGKGREEVNFKLNGKLFESFDSYYDSNNKQIVVVCKSADSGIQLSRFNSDL